MPTYPFRSRPILRDDAPGRYVEVAINRMVKPQTKRPALRGASRVQGGENEREPHGLVVHRLDKPSSYRWEPQKTAWPGF